MRRLYGPKSERFRPDQPGLFDGLLGTEPAPPPANADTTDEPAIPSRRQGHGGRRLPADLQRERVVHDLPEAEKNCPCCQQPRIPIGKETSNNAVERALRAVAIDRKNYRFAGSDAGGKTAAVLYTMTQTCKRHGIDPFAYLEDVLTRLPTLPTERLPELFPHAWAQFQRARVA